jgi:hypothetical protein
MAKFFGKVGYGPRRRLKMGYGSDEIVEKKHYGDVVRNSRRLVDGQQVNNDLTVSVTPLALLPMLTPSRTSLPFAMWSGRGLCGPLLTSKCRAPALSCGWEVFTTARDRMAPPAATPRGNAGSDNVYFQPPSKCARWSTRNRLQRDIGLPTFADDRPYTTFTKRYQVTVIDRDPDSEIPDRVAALPQCGYNGSSRQTGLNHDVFTFTSERKAMTAPAPRVSSGTRSASASTRPVSTVACSTSAAPTVRTRSAWPGTVSRPSPSRLVELTPTRCTPTTSSTST